MLERKIGSILKLKTSEASGFSKIQDTFYKLFGKDYLFLFINLYSLHGDNAYLLYGYLLLWLSIIKKVDCQESTKFITCSYEEQIIFSFHYHLS